MPSPYREWRTYMRILQLLATAALAVMVSVIVCGCDTGNSCSVSSAQTDEKRGHVIIPLPRNHTNNERSVNLETAQTYTNYYEAVFIKDKVTQSATAGEGAEQIEITIAEGVYTILLAAGCKSTLTNPLLLASGYVEGKSITAGDNIVEITLRPIAVEITAPAEVVQNQTFDVRVDIDTKNPYVTLATLPLYFNTLNTKINSSDFTNSGNNYTWTYEVDAPPAIGANVVFISQTFNAIPKSSWYIGYYAASTSHFENIRDYYRKTVSVIQADDLPKVNIVVKWGD
jgi:hypothetical protein